MLSNRAPNNSLRVVVTAASRLAASQLACELSTDSSLLVSFASDARRLLDEVRASRPNVVLLDSRIAGNGAPQLVEELVQKFELPVLLRTEIGENSPDMLIDCIQSGAIGIINKPVNAGQITQSMPDLIWTLKAASSASISNLKALQNSAWPMAEAVHAEGVLAVGAPLGGALALAGILTQLPANVPGAVAVVPLPVQVIGPWANRMSARCKVNVKLARDGDPIVSGQVLIAPGEAHLVVRNQSGQRFVKIKDGPAVFHQKPSIEVLFSSLAECGADVVGVLLGGAGVDGIAGLLQLKNAGGRTLTESPTASIFKELPGKALLCGAAQTHASATELANTMLQMARSGEKNQAA